MNTHVFLTTTIDSGLLSDAEIVAFSRLLDFLAAYHMEHYTFTLEDLGNLWGRTRPLKRRQVREYISALKRLPWLDVVSASGQVVISLRPDKLPRADGANAKENGANDAENGAIDAISGANDALSVRFGGDYRGGAWLVASESDPVRVNLLFRGVTRKSCWEPEASNQASNKYSAAPHRYRTDGAQLAHQECSNNALPPPHQERTVGASVLQRERSNSAPLPDVPDDLLRAVLDALDALPPENGVSESGARAIIADALARGVAPEVILAVALAVGARAETGGQVGGGLFRSLVGKSDPAREVPRVFVAQAREILGLEPEEDEDEGDMDEGVEVEIVGDPPYDPREMWEKARARLRAEMEPRDFNTWIRDTVLLGWREGEFVLGAPNALAKDWLRNRLNGHVSHALAQSAGLEEGGISVCYVVAPVRRW